MTTGSVGRGPLLLLAAVFTAGLTFATLELPHLLDGFLQRTITTPGGDSHADTVARLKTELFMAHYHVRALGYTGFFLLLGLIGVGFATRRTGWATLGAFGVMLSVFAQFASVMFFLAGLGMLNALWLPILDIPYELQSWGAVIDLPNDLLRRLMALVGIDSPWPTILFFIGSGILVFLVGVYAWLSARAKGDHVARGWVYRISRHPQYLGWILWTYGAYLLIGLDRYPKRSWGIGASLPWLVSTLVILAVALVEELNMRERHGESYEAYRRSAPFLLPLPGWLTRALGLPVRVLFGRERPERVREVVAVVGLYGGLLVTASVASYGGGMRGLDEAEAALLEALGDSDEGVRHQAALALGAIGSPMAYPALSDRLVDPAGVVRTDVFQLLGDLGAEEVLYWAPALLEDENEWVRSGAVAVLGTLGSESGLPLVVRALDDPEPRVRREAVIALLRIGSPTARPALEQALDDEDYEVRIYAAETLKRM